MIQLRFFLVFKKFFKASLRSIEQRNFVLEKEIFIERNALSVKVNEINLKSYKKFKVKGG
jgi:hypothetical protein